MTREEHLKICKTCKSQVKDLKKGIICGITGTYADFDDTCSFYQEDSERKEIEESTIVENTGVQKQITYTKAPLGKRFANHLIDTLFLYIMVFIIGVLYGTVMVMNDPAFFDEIGEGNIVLQYVLGFIAIFIYYSIFEGLTGRSPAKYITKTKVVDLNGEKPDFATIFIRTLCRAIPFDAFSFLFSQDSGGWHDRLSKTSVVDC